MSDIENVDTRGTATGWTEREMLCYVFGAIEFSSAKIDSSNAPAPVGRKKAACAQRISKLKKVLRNDMDALKAAKGKRKAEDGENEILKKRGRGTKSVEPELEVKQEVTPESEGMGRAEEFEEEV